VRRFPKQKYCGNSVLLRLTNKNPMAVQDEDDVLRETFFFSFFTDGKYVYGYFISSVMSACVSVLHTCHS